MSSFKKIRQKAEILLSCPSCGEPVEDIVYRFSSSDGNSDFYHCKACTFIFARPVLIPELDSRQMDGLENAELFNSRFLKSIYINYFIKKEIRALRRVKGRGALRLLDIGCGTGWTTHVYADQGFDVVGLEPSEVRASYARQNYNLDVVCDYIENARFEREFDVVVLRHIIEHFADPKAVLDKIRGFLKNDGVVLAVVPNINCLGRYLFETRWAWVLPWHCNFFAPQSTRRLLTGAHFKVVNLYQTPSPLYYPGALMKSFSNRFLKWLLGGNRVLAMMICAPLAFGGLVLGLGDNINALARVDGENEYGAE